MLPSVLLAGVLVGVVARGTAWFLLGGAVALAWAAIVGVADGSLRTFVAALGLGAANVVVGSAIGWTLRWTLARATGIEVASVGRRETRPRRSRR